MFIRTAEFCKEGSGRQGADSGQQKAEFFACAKANPGKLNYGLQGNDATGHLIAALMEMMPGTRHAHVPHNRAAPVLNDLAARYFDFMFADIGYPALLSDTWRAFTAPPGTRLAIREKLSAAIREAVFSDVVKAKIEPPASSHGG
jgi:tripartite-type tricarboxylate transporter receptor subunit TctC